MSRYLATDDMVRYADTAEKHGRLQGIIENSHKLLDHRLEGNEEQALIITDTEVSPILYHSIAGVLSAKGIEPTITLMQQLDAPNQEPTETIAEAAKVTDVIINMCVYTITHTEAIEHATLELDIPYILLADPTEDTFSRGMIDADPQGTDDFTKRVANILQEGDLVEVTSPQGTDVEMSIEGRDQIVVEYPLGETPTCPVEESVNGTVVHDSFMMGVGVLEDPIVWEIEDGRIQEIRGGREAQQLSNFVREQGDENSYWIGEFSVMTQPKARPSGNYIEHKQVRGGVHIALGSGRDLGGKYYSSIHLDGVQLAPTVKVDGEVLVHEGVIQEDLLPEEGELMEGMRTG